MSAAAAGGGAAPKRSRSGSADDGAAGPLAQRIGFIGGGMMATALVKGLVAAGVAEPSRVTVSDMAGPSLEANFGGTGVNTTTDNAVVVSNSDIVVLAVKPNIVSVVLEGVGALITKDHLVVSIAAGVSIDTIAGQLPEGTRVVRVMPNTPCLVGETAAGYALGPSALKEDGEVVGTMLSAVGVAEPVPEKLMDGALMPLQQTSRGSVRRCVHARMLSLTHIATRLIAHCASCSCDGA